MTCVDKTVQQLYIFNEYRDGERFMNQFNYIQLENLPYSLNVFPSLLVWLFIKSK